MRYLLTLLAFFSFSTLGYSDTVSFTDNNFFSPDYIEYQSGTGTTSAVTQTTGGNPGYFRSISLTVDPYEHVINAQLYKNAQFTPATQGAINSVYMGFDIRRVSTSHPAAQQVAKGLAIEQDGVVHYHLGGVSVEVAWEHYGASDIVSLFPDVNWINGNTITFGFYNSCSTTYTPFTIVGGYDNFTVNINYSPPTLIELTLFSAKGSSHGAFLNWETASEIDTAGFHIWRRREDQNEFVRITRHLIPAVGGPTSGARYALLDRVALGKKKCWYCLEDITHSGIRTFHRPAIVRRIR